MCVSACDVFRDNFFPNNAIRRTHPAFTYFNMYLTTLEMFNYKHSSSLTLAPEYRQLHSEKDDQHIVKFVLLKYTY